MAESRDLSPELLRTARSIAYDYFLPGDDDRSEILQEAMIGAWAATRSYRPELGPFWPFARMVIRRRLISVVKTANREKRHVERDALRYVRVETPDGGEELADISGFWRDDRADVPAAAAARIELARIRRLLPTLSPLERRSLLGLAAGLTYQEIGPTKTVDNALQRARRKLAA